MEKPRRRFTSEEKVKALRRHLVDKVPVSDLCEELGLHPTQFYQWQKQFFENGTAAFERQSRPETSAREQRIAFLESKRQRKDEVLSELMEEHVALKKSWGGMKGLWVPHDTRDAIMDFANGWPAKTELPLCQFVRWPTLTARNCTLTIAGNSPAVVASESIWGISDKENRPLRPERAAHAEIGECTWR